MLNYEKDLSSTKQFSYPFLLKILRFLFSLSLLSAVAKTLVFSPSYIKEGWFRVNFWPKITLLTRFFLFPFYWNKWFSHLFHFLFCDFVIFVRRWFVRRFCATLFVFLVSLRYLIGSDCQINFDPVQIQSMTLTSSTLQIRIHGYSKDLNIIMCVGICTFPFHAINMDVVSLFTDSFFLFLANVLQLESLPQLVLPR